MSTIALEEGMKAERTIVGMWVYLMSDCILFASLFAVYAVLHGNTFGGPESRELFSLPIAFVETILLLGSSTAAGFAALAARENKRGATVAWLVITLVLALAFLGIEISDFASLVHDGNSWQRSGFLSAFFALVGTHGLHVALGSLWLLGIILATIRRGFSAKNLRMISSFALFWHFIDLIWIFIFSIVYLFGAL